jgi:hypothetical protein
MIQFLFIFPFLFGTHNVPPDELKDFGLFLLGFLRHGGIGFIKGEVGDLIKASLVTI